VLVDHLATPDGHSAQDIIIKIINYSY